jgi:polyisoprenoid-binding protein YceI
MAWTIDKAHSSVGFAVRHMMMMTVRGSFGSYEAEAQLDPGDLEHAKVTALIDTASVDTKEEKRDGHLRSPDFFDSERYPKMVFTSTRIMGSGANLEVSGTLRIKDQEHPIVLHGEVVGPAKDPWGNLKLGVSLAGEIDRELWGLTWNQALEAGGVLVAKRVKIELEVQLIQS